MLIKNILVPTDFSENAKNAAEFAFSLFRSERVNYTFLNIYHIPVVAPEMPADVIFQAIEESKAFSKENLSDLCRQYEADKKISSCNHILKPEPLSDACKEVVAENNIDLVVMGTHGATGLKKIIFGSNAANVIRTSSVPVLAIPEDAMFVKMRNMLFATDYHDSDLEDIKSLAVMAAKFDAEIMVVHVSDGKNADSEMLRWFEGQVRKKTDYPKLLFFLLGQDDLLASLDTFIKDNHIDLLAMSTRKRSPFEKLFSPSQTKRMVFHTSIPLLAFHARDTEDENF